MPKACFGSAGPPIAHLNTTRHLANVYRRSRATCRVWSTGREIRLIHEDDGGWSAIDRESGVASEGETRNAALENLDEAVELTLEARSETDEARKPQAPWFDE